MVTVTRYIVTVRGRYGRQGVQACQGRNTFATEIEAQTYLSNILKNNGIERLQEVFGPDPQFKVMAVPCYPGHFDPIHSLYPD